MDLHHCELLDDGVPLGEVMEAEVRDEKGWGAWFKRLTMSS